MTIKSYKLIKAAILSIILMGISSRISAQTHSIVLGRPTDTSITASIMFDQNVQYYITYGIQSAVYTHTTSVITNTINVPDEIDLGGLTPDTKNYYKVFYKVVGNPNYTFTPEYSFHTQRAPGSSFVFTLESDEHLYDYGNANLYNYTLQNEAKSNPDFMMTLGDIFGDDHYPTTMTSHQMDSLHEVYRPRLGAVTHSIPFYIALGNHEGEKDYWLLQTPPNNIGVYGTLARKKYYPNPYPNSFYSGNTNAEAYGMGEPEDYYSFTWGDALFVVLDPYRFDCDTSAKPTGWNWTLGFTQYTWLQNVLQNSSAKFKFVFLHHPLGENRGGIIPARQYEWGGYQGPTSTNYTFPTHRPGWAMPIHKLFVTYGVNILFQGHDHLFAREVMDSVIYQEVPMAADSTYQKGMLANASAYTADTLAGTGHIRVTVNSSCVKVEYVLSYLPKDTLSGVNHNDSVAFSYVVGACAATGINTINANNFIKVFPNPAKDKITVQLPEGTKNYQIQLSNAFGQKILQTQSNEIDVSSVSSGIYFLSIDTDNYHANKKVIITR